MKQTLLDIRRTTNVTTKDIAERAGLSAGDVFVVEAGGYTTNENVQRVLAAFNQLSGMRVRLTDIKMNPDPSTLSDIPPLRNRNLTAFNRGLHHG